MSADPVEARIARLEQRVVDLARGARAAEVPNLRHLADTRPLTKAKDGDVVAYDKATGLWVPRGVSGVSPSSTVVSETTAGLSPGAGSSLLYARGDHTHGTPSASVPSACVTRSTDLGPISQTAEPTVGWQLAVWDNGVDTTGQALWNGDHALICRRAGIYSIFGGTFWSTPQGGSSGQITAHVRIADFENILDPHHYFGGTGPLVGPAMTFGRDWPLEVDQSVVLKVLYQYSPLGPDLSLKAGRGLTYLGFTWRGYL